LIALRYAALHRYGALMRRSILLLCAVLPLALTAGCAGTIAAPPPWQKIIREPDRKRLAGLHGAWTESLGEARAAGAGDAVAALGAVAQPDAVGAGPLPGPGDYRCRSLRIGGRRGDVAGAAPPVVVAPAVPCRISAKDGLLWLEQAQGPQRVGGTLFPDGDRLVFLGSMALTGEMGMMRYGADKERDQVGVLRSLGPALWRLELPWPMWQSDLAIIEIVPA
jgi:hypothetical protein